MDLLYKKIFKKQIKKEYFAEPESEPSGGWGKGRKMSEEEKEGGRRLVFILFVLLVIFVLYIKFYEWVTGKKFETR